MQSVELSRLFLKKAACIPTNESSRLSQGLSFKMDVRREIKGCLFLPENVDVRRKDYSSYDAGPSPPSMNWPEVITLLGTSERMAGGIASIH